MEASRCATAGSHSSSAPAHDIEGGQDFLFCALNPSSIWPVLSGNDEEGTWVNYDPVFKEQEQMWGFEISRTLAPKVSGLPSCGCNCGCMLLHIGNVSSNCKRSSVAQVIGELLVDCDLQSIDLLSVDDF